MDNNKNIACFVSLDLGSDSIAAFYENINTNKSGMIGLQEYGAVLLGSEPNYLRENGGQISKRLRTKIGLREHVQEDELNDNHALLDFIDDNGSIMKTNYEKSLFQFFLPVGPVAQYFMPNPKIPFQEGAEKIIPILKTNKNVDARYSPEILIQHMITQIIRNFVLRSKELIKVTENQIHLILTIPNVYSLPHVQSIKNFVQSHTNLAAVTTLYESDAVTYYMLNEVMEKDDEKLKEIKDKIRDIFISKKKLRLLSIDIGRGTTDVSLVEIKEPSSSGKLRTNSTIARTGKSDGGNKLSYIIAEYLNEQLKNIFDEIKRKGFDINLPFNLLINDTPSHAVSSEQRIVLSYVERLIELYKSKIIYSKGIKSFQIRTFNNDEKEIITELCNKYFEIIKSSSTGFENNSDFIEFKNLMLQKFSLPQKFPDDFITGLKLKTFKHLKFLKYFYNEHFFQVIQDNEIVKMKKKLNKYISENVKYLINDINNIITYRENKKNTNKNVRKMLSKDDTMVIIAGQASQFEPITKQICNSFNELGIPENNLYFFKGMLAKEACCRGAIVLRKTLDDQLNTKQLHGTYGMLATSIDSEPFKIFDMTRIRNGGSHSIRFIRNTTRTFIYCPHILTDKNKPPSRDDGYTATIKQFNGSEFELNYDSDNLEIAINHIKINKIASYGDVSDKIYPKIWPEVLEPKKKT